MKVVAQELEDRITEVELTYTLSILTALEAAFRIDYLQRCYRKETDTISREFRDIYKMKQEHASLEEDIFGIWQKKASSDGARLIGNLRGAFKYRHWLAHGRYWTPKLGRKYDFWAVYGLAETVLNSFPLIASQ